MIVKIDKSLERDVKKITDSAIKKNLTKTIIEIEIANDIFELKNVKKLKGHKNFYRIRIGDYRLGLILTGNTAELIRFLHRKDIYRYFPS
jgi:mRNA interferase RelE/StbE